MKNTGTALVEWISLNGQNARDARESGGQADDGAVLDVLISGLLPEVDQMKFALDQIDGLTLAVAITKLTSFAITNNLMEVCKGKGMTGGGARVFAAEAQAGQQPRRKQPPPIPFKDRHCNQWKYKGPLQLWEVMQIQSRWPQGKWN